MPCSAWLCQPRGRTGCKQEGGLQFPNRSPIIGAAVISLAGCAHHQLCSRICLVHCSHTKRPCRPAIALTPCEGSWKDHLCDSARKQDLHPSQILRLAEARRTQASSDIAPVVLNVPHQRSHGVHLKLVMQEDQELSHDHAPADHSADRSTSGVRLSPAVSLQSLLCKKDSEP